MPFGSAIAVLAVCGHCRSSVVRRDVDVEAMGQQAQMPPDLSPLQVGAEGEYEGRRFRLVGRVRVGYREGTWNEWCADFGDGVWGWVAEAQGILMVSFEIAAPDTLPGVREWRAGVDRDEKKIGLVDARLVRGREALTVGRRFRIGETEYTVRDTKQTEVMAAEGSLPFLALPGRAAISGDLGGDGRSFANVEYSEEGVRVFVGGYRTMSELKWAGLRLLPGWTTDRLETEERVGAAVNCPQCGASTTLRAAGLTMVATCGSCGGVLDTSHPEVQWVAQASRRQENVRPWLPVGVRGELRGVRYECIGFLRRRDTYGDSWDEYLLFNPFEGFRWLVRFAGHWTWVTPLIDAPLTGGDEVVWEGESYRLFGRGRATVTYVLGEFYWQVRHGEAVDVEDFIAPPRVLSREKYPTLTEETWSLGEYLPGEEVRAAFGIAEEWPEPTGAYLNQPNPHREKGRTLRWLMPLMAGVFLLVSLIGASMKEAAPVWEGHFDGMKRETGGTNSAVVTEVFELKGTHRQSVEVGLSAPVSNAWLEIEADLVNEATGQTEREFVLGVDYYSGTEDGEFWEEGARERTVLLSAVPPGRYRLVMEPSTEPGQDPTPYGVRIRRDVMIWSNVWMGLATLLAYPVFRWIREYSFERSRWSVSDFSPYASSDSDDGGEDGFDGGGE